VIEYFICFTFGLLFVVSTSAVDCLERLISGMTCCVVKWDVKP